MSRSLSLFYSCLFLWLLSIVVHADKLQFNKDIRPILSQNCFHCHGPDDTTREAKLRLDTFKGALRNDAIVPGKPEASEIIYRMTTDDKDELMPPPEHHLKVSKKDIETLRQWIREGATYQQHWSFEKPVASVKGELSEIIDLEIKKKLATVQLTPSKQANRETLIRRLSLDLRGLPPTLAEVDAFVADSSVNAYEKLVDRMLASPQTAERLTLDWLDVARFADTNGYSIDDHRDMWGWRDWVIHSFMNNKPYDQFLTEQIAGDLIAKATSEQVMATGFLRNSMNTHEGGIIAEEYRVAYIADKVDTVSSAFLGLTMKCAQCHNHKYDPISQKDYYQFYAFFNSATEHGKGATNGNTEPTIKVTSPLHRLTNSHQDLKSRAQRIRNLRQQLDKPHPEQLDAWRAGLIAKARNSKKKASEAGFIFPEKGPVAQWIWANETGANDHLLARVSPTIEKKLVNAKVVFTSDNSATLYVNGKKLASMEDWTKPSLVDITEHLRQGENRVGAELRNAGGQAGFIAWIRLEYADGETEYLVSGPKWQWKRMDSGDIGKQLASNKDWRIPKLLGEHGVAPWRKLKIQQHTGSSATLINIVRKDPDSLSVAERKLLHDAYFKDSLGFTKKIKKSLGIELGVLEKQVKQAGKTSVMVMDAPGKRKTHILVRGEYNNLGEEVTAAVPKIFTQLPEGEAANRLGLARWMTSPDNPLTARVAVNRYWQLLFGYGLVRTAEDFGSQGEWPTHQALLDTLAVQFREGGWDIRALLKGMVLSNTYRQRSEITAEWLKVDPQNRLLGRAPRARLSAELIRDNALAISGQLNLRLGGPSVYPEQPDGLWRQVSHFGYGSFTAQAYYPDTGEQAKRRSMYSFWKRTSPPPALSIFDAPTRETCTVRRLQTNTPLQALVLLNDPQYLKAAGALARRMLADGGATAEKQIAFAFRLATARQPKAEELAILTASFNREKSRLTADPKATKGLLRETGSTGKDPNLAALTMVASIILNLNETITKQ